MVDATRGKCASVLCGEGAYEEAAGQPAWRAVFLLVIDTVIGYILNLDLAALDLTEFRM